MAAADTPDTAARRAGETWSTKNQEKRIMTVNDFINDLVKILTTEGTEARMAAEDIAADLLIWIEQVPWASAELDRRKVQVGQQLLRLRGAKPKNVDTRKVTIWLPPEFIRLCARDQV